ADRVHHRLSGTAPDRRTTGTDLFGDEALRPGNGSGGGQPGTAVYVAPLISLARGLRRQTTRRQIGGLPRKAPATSATSVNTKKMKNRTFAMLAAAPATLVKPSTAAMIATTKNVSAHESIRTS